MIKNRRVKCEICKTIQEKQFEPLRVMMAIEGDIPDNVDAKSELQNLGQFLENCIYDQIEKMTT